MHDLLSGCFLPELCRAYFGGEFFATGWEGEFVCSDLGLGWDVEGLMYEIEEVLERVGFGYVD